MVFGLSWIARSLKAAKKVVLSERIRLFLKYWRDFMLACGYPQGM